MKTSNRTLVDRNRAQAARIDRLIDERDSLKKDADACAYALRQVAEELDRMKEVVALHIVAARHPSTVVHDLTAFAYSLRESLAANGVDLRLELARLEGADL